ncbi:MAG: exonuclease domain-containing protein [Bacteroidetes bacterium]|nr:exonuclease domain-containing protein [Bacteroidota bacterium]MDA0888130.1 exonuclease domain-containing protein [Bacteroidota bacterium]MDA1084082.1 exonuclease domain-containing protein [Bacteroidota bacterium]
MYAVVDVETTGGKYNEEGITEIAVYKFDGNKIVDQFISLVNPERPILPFVANLTGINEKMLRNAPKFYEVAKRIVEITEDCTLVAHNASFDYRMLCTEFNRLGFTYERPTLCTFSLAKKLIPEQASYKLGKLVRSLGIPLSDRHRAAGDARATVKLLKLLLDKDTEKNIVKEVLRTKKQDQVTRKFLKLVEQAKPVTGVYYLHNQQGDVIYIGKSTNMRKRLNQHFTGKSRKALKIQLETHSVSTEETGSELIALLKEVDEIQLHKPKHNRVHKNDRIRFGLEEGVTSLGYRFLRIVHTQDGIAYVTTFKNLNNARKTLYFFTQKYTLCLKLVGLECPKNACSHEQINQCLGACIEKETAEQYNNRVQQCMDRLSFQSPNMLLIDKGRTHDERSIVLIQDNEYKGFGFVSLNYQLTNMDMINTLITPMKNSRAARHIIQQFVRKNKVKEIVNLDETP